MFLHLRASVILSIFEPEFQNFSFMPLKKSLRMLLFAAICLMVLASCSSSRKTKKKCLDCPKFSQAELLFNPVSGPDGKI